MVFEDVVHFREILTMVDFLDEVPNLGLEDSMGDFALKESLVS